jgi:hypothetical protein
MYHQIQFRASYQVDLQVPDKPRLERLLIKQGEVIEAQVRPYVVETSDGPMEVADLQLAGDGTLLAVPMEYFCFV